MYIRYGNYTHAQNEATVAIQRTSILAPNGIIRGYKEVWNISGMLQAANQSLLTSAILTLKSAYAVHGHHLGLYFDNGTPANHALPSLGSAGGTRVTTPPSFPVGEGAEYSTFRTYTVQVEAEYYDPAVQLLEWAEAISWSGGGPLDLHLQPINGKPIKQRVAEATPFQASIDGEAIGAFTWPNPPAPLWPFAWIQPRSRITRGKPKRLGQAGRSYFTDFVTSWHYEFESADPLIGNPRLSPV